MRMTKDRAEELLEMPERTTYDAAKLETFYRRAVMKHHPDSQGQAVGEWHRKTIDELKAARDHLRRVVAGTDNPCPQCKGKGRVPFGMGSATCGACKGTGDKTP